MGPRVKAHKLRENNRQELKKQLDEFKAELAQLRVAKVSGGVSSKLSKIRVVQRNIARVKTVINQKQKMELRKVYDGKKLVPLDLRSKKTRAIRRRLTYHERTRRTLREQKRDANYPKPSSVRRVRRYALRSAE